MTLQNILTWLQNPARDYKTGLEIYMEYRSNKKFDQFFQSVTEPAPGSMQFKMLLQKVNEIYRKVQQNPGLTKPEPITVKPINIDELKKNKLDPIGSNRPRIVENPLVNVKELPEDLQKLYFENKALTKEISDLHTQLKALPKDKRYDNKRKELANIICLKDDKRAANWLAIDTWWRDNKELTEDQKKQFDARRIDLKSALKEAKIIIQRIDTLKINISREKKRVEKDPQLAEKLNTKITEWEKELGELEEKMR